MEGKKIVTVTLHLLSGDHEKLRKIKESRHQTWEKFVIGMAKETCEYHD